MPKITEIKASYGLTKNLGNMDKPEYTDDEKEILERIEELKAEAKMGLDRMEKLLKEAEKWKEESLK